MASQAGNDDYFPAQDVSRTLVVADPAFVELQDYRIQLYPNPAGNEFFLEAHGEYSLSIHGMRGGLIMEKNDLEGLEKIAIPDLTHGIYIVKISGDVFHDVKKLLIY